MPPGYRTFRRWQSFRRSRASTCGTRGFRPPRSTNYVLIGPIWYHGPGIVLSPDDHSMVAREINMKKGAAGHHIHSILPSLANPTRSVHNGVYVRLVSGRPKTMKCDQCGAETRVRHLLAIPCVASRPRGTTFILSRTRHTYCGFAVDATGAGQRKSH